MTVAGIEVGFEGERNYDAEPPDQLTFNVLVPHTQPGTYPQSADVTVEYGDRATLKDAFTLVAPDPGSVPGPSPDDCPVTSSEESDSTGTASSR
ncbi:hypothetical protein [Streptomyces sp. NPDC002545]